MRDFVEKEITPYAAEMDRNNQSMPGLLEKAADMGLLNVIVPEEYGGPGLDSVTVAVIYEELGKGCAGVATSMAANSLASYPILIAGTEEQKQAHCDLLNDGKLAAFALTEPGAGSDAGGVATSAVKTRKPELILLMVLKRLLLMVELQILILYLLIPANPVVSVV